MFISKLILKNWKNFKHVDIDLQHRVFIVGPNASGKSNLLDVFRFLRDLTRKGGGLQQAVEQRGGVSKIRCLSARVPSEVQIAIELSEDMSKKPLWKYEVGFTQTGGGVQPLKAIIKYERAQNLETGKTELNRPDDNDKKDERLKDYTHLEQPTSNFHFRAIADFFEGIQYLHIIPYLVRVSRQIVMPESQEDYFGKNFIERINKTNPSTRSSYFKKIKHALHLAVPQFQDLDLVQDSMGIPHLQAIYQHWRPRGAKQWEDQFSDGTLRLIGFLWALLDGNKPVLLEEPELSLHTAIVSRLAEIIATLQKKKSGLRQVMLSTHSFDLLDNKGIQGEETVLLIPKSEGTEVKLATSDKEISRLLESGMSVAETVLPLAAPQDAEQLSFVF